MSRTLQIFFHKAGFRVPKDVCSIINNDLCQLDLGLVFCSATKKEKWYYVLITRCFECYIALDVGLSKRKASHKLDIVYTKIIPWILCFVADTWLQKNGWDFPLTRGMRMRIYSLLPHLLPFRFVKCTERTKLTINGSLYHPPTTISILDYHNFPTKVDVFMSANYEYKGWYPCLKFELPRLPAKDKWTMWIKEEEIILKILNASEILVCGPHVPLSEHFSCCPHTRYCGCGVCSGITTEGFDHLPLKLKNELSVNPLSLQWLVYSVHMATVGKIACENVFSYCRQLVEIGVPFTEPILKFLKKNSRLFKIWLKQRCA